MLVSLLGTGVASAAAIAVYSTGASVTAGLDNNYQIIADTTGEASTPPTPAVIITNIPPLWHGVPGASWIGPQPNQAESNTPNGCCLGSDTYQTTFSLAGLDPTTAQLNIVLSADDEANIWLNGVEVYKAGGIQYNPGNVPIVISSDFVAGLNDLDFVVLNGTGSTGLDASVSGTASILNPNVSLVPEPNTDGLLLGLGVLAVVLGVRQKQLLVRRPNRAL